MRKLQERFALTRSVGVESVDLVVRFDKGCGDDNDSFNRVCQELNARGLNINSLSMTTRDPFGGCRKPKRPRV